MQKIKKINSLIHFFWLELKRNIFGKKYFAEFDITENCNLRCKHCYHFRGKETIIKEELPLNIWEKRLKDLYSKGVRSVLLVGGEPALRKDVLELANNIFPYIYIITNGTILIPKEYNFLLFVSIDGKQDTNDLIRGKGVFSKVIENYSGDNRVMINITITNDNYKELEDVIHIAKTNGFKGVVCNIYTPKINEESALFVTKQQRKLIINEMKRVKDLYPKHFLLTKSMIKWYEYPDHIDYCFWRKEVFHFDILWKERMCFADVDCSNCGCFAGSFQTPFEMFKNLEETAKFII